MVMTIGWYLLAFGVFVALAYVPQSSRAEWQRVAHETKAATFWQRTRRQAVIVLAALAWYAAGFAVLWLVWAERLAP